MPPHGAGFAATDWSSLTVGQMWDLIKDDVAANTDWDQALAWQRTFELVDYHQARLRHYRDLLAERWPPEKSPAARLFITKLDQMLDSMRVMGDASVANGPALIQLTGGLSEARQMLTPVYRQWAANEAKLNSGRLAQAPRSSTPTPSPLPAPAPGPVPVAPGEQQRLHSQAVAIMTSLGTNTLEARSAMQTPPLYAPPKPIGSEQVVVLPPSRSHAASHPQSVSSDGAVPSASSPAPSSTATGPLLDGTGVATTVPSIHEQHRPPTSVSGPSPSAPITTNPIPLVPRLAPLSDSIVSPGSATDSTSNSPPTHSRRRLRAGGVIGGDPFEDAHSGIVRDDRPNAVGGLIGQEDAPEGQSLVGPMSSGTAGRRTDTSDANQSDSIQSWDVPTGVPPILEPPPEYVFRDPGPAIGLRP